MSYEGLDQSYEIYQPTPYPLNHFVKANISCKSPSSWPFMKFAIFKNFWLFKISASRQKFENQILLHRIDLSWI